MGKTTFLQIRVSPEEKAEIVKGASAEGVSISEWVLGRLLSAEQRKFQAIIENFDEENPQYSFAELHDFLMRLDRSKFVEATSDMPKLSMLEALAQNYIAAMLDERASQLKIGAPKWLKMIKGLEQPFFASELSSLRLHLLTSSPPSYRRRNIFVDSSLGDRV